MGHPDKIDLMQKQECHSNVDEEPSVTHSETLVSDDEVNQAYHPLASMSMVQQATKSQPPLSKKELGSFGQQAINLRNEKHDSQASS